MEATPETMPSSAAREQIVSGTLPKPPIPYLQRQVLVERLMGQSCRLRLLQAPPGYGKTTLMAGCALKGGRKVAWIALGGRAVAPAELIGLIGEVLSPGVDRWDEPKVISALSSQREPLWLMLDDYPRELDGELDALVGRLLLTHTGHVEWWISSRRRPLCNLPRLMLQNDLLELRAEHMAFDEAEVAELLTAISDSHLSALDLFRDTQGWCAAVAFRLMRAPVSDTLLAEYLKYELLDALPKDQRQALVTLANFSRFDTELCEQLFGRSEGADLLRELERKGAFLAVVPNAPEWLHVISPAANALASFASQTDLREKRRQACQNLIQRGELRLAIEQAVLSGRYEVAASLLEKLSEEELVNEQAAIKVLGYRDQLPADLLESTPKLAILYAFTFALGNRPKDAIYCLGALSKFLPASSATEQRRLVASWLSIRGQAAHCEGDSELAGHYCREALNDLEPSEWPLRLSCWAILIQQQVFWGNLEQAEAYTREAVGLAQSTGKVGAICLASIYEAVVLESKGQLSTAWQVMDQHLNLLKSQPAARPVVRGRLLLRQGYIAMRLGRLKQARQLFAEGYTFCSLSLDTIGFHGLVGLSTLALLDGDHEEAESLLDQAASWMLEYDIAEVIYRSVIDQARAYAAVERGALDTAQELLEGVIARHKVPGGLVQPFVPSDFLSYTQCLLARIEMQKGLPAQAEQRLWRLHEHAQEQGFALAVCEIELLQAEIAFSCGDEAQARILVVQALEKCERLEFKLPLERLQRQNPKLFRLAGSSVSSGLLSQREIEVLRLVESGLSNQEIADQLHISLFTVKSHVQRLSGKLEVRRRTQAVSKAKALGLI